MTTEHHRHNAPSAKPPRIQALSLGAGVQSSALLLMSAHGLLPKLDYAAFADTGWERPETYAALDRLEHEVAKPAGIEVVRLRAGDIRRDALDPNSRFSTMPMFIRNPNGSKGMLRRQCTSTYKIKILLAEARRRLGAEVFDDGRIGRVKRSQSLSMWVGISSDEFHRAKDSGVKYAVNEFPLLQLGLTRADTQAYLDQHGFAAVSKSACVGCLMWNQPGLRSEDMVLIPWSKFPLVAGHEHAQRWLQFTANIGRAANTVDAYGRALEDHLRFCTRIGADPLTIHSDVVAAWIGDMYERPNPRSSKVVHLDSGVGLANATIQQRVIAVRSFYEFLVEDELRERNPVRRGQSGRRGRAPKQGLVRRLEKAPWIPNEDGWAAILDAAGAESLRNRLMVALAYDGALRREELVQLDVGDFEPAHFLIHLRAETTKSLRAREVAYGQATATLFASYLAFRRQHFGRIAGALFRSESRRNPGAPLGRSSWSKTVDGIGERAGVPQLTTHTFRHLRLTDLARADWTVDQIAQYAGHRDLATTMKYIHLSGRELAARLRRASASVQADRERLLASLAVAP